MHMPRVIPHQCIRRCIFFLTHGRVHMEDIRPTHASMHVRHCSMFTFAFANIISSHPYILHQKLNEVKNMLSAGMSIYETSYTLCFCNESHFIQAFNKRFHMTLAVYIAKTIKSNNDPICHCCFLTITSMFLVYISLFRRGFR